MVQIKISDHNEKIISLLDKYKNLSIFPSNNFIYLELFFHDYEINSSLINQIKEEFSSYELIEIGKKDWINQNIKDDKGLETEFFFISQGLSNIFKKKKFKLIIPANNAFGTGRHESTLLSIISIEFLVKKKNYYRICDLGTGSGILSFILRKITKKIIISIDIDYQIKESFDRNLKINHLNNIKFFRNDGLNCNILRNNKFDLIVSNMLSNSQIKLAKQYYNKLEKNGELVISGVLIDQQNEVISYLNKFNLKLKKKFYCFNWVALIFIKKGKKVG